MDNKYMKYVELHDNFLSAEECKDIIHRYKIGSEEYRFQFPNELPDIKGDSEAVFGLEGLTINSIVEKTGKFVTKYLEKNDIKTEVYPTTVCFLQHKEGAPMKKHYDEEMDFFKNEESFRLCAALIYLNDDYKDGEIVFPDIDFTYKPKAGTLILFPTSFIFTHSVNPAIGNNKYLVKFSYQVDKDQYTQSL